MDNNSCYNLQVQSCYLFACGKWELKNKNIEYSSPRPVFDINSSLFWSRRIFEVLLTVPPSFAMATVIAIDLSVSMIRDIKIKDTNESFTLLQLATHGVNVLLDYLAVHSKLEFVAVVSVFLDCHSGLSGGEAEGWALPLPLLKF